MDDRSCTSWQTSQDSDIANPPTQDDQGNANWPDLTNTHMEPTSSTARPSVETNADSPDTILQLPQRTVDSTNEDIIREFDLVPWPSDSSSSSSVSHADSEFDHEPIIPGAPDCTSDINQVVAVSPHGIAECVFPNCHCCKTLWDIRRPPPRNPVLQALLQGILRPITYTIPTAATTQTSNTADQASPSAHWDLETARGYVQFRWTRIAPRQNPERHAATTSHVSSSSRPETAPATTGSS